MTNDEIYMRRCIQLAMNGKKNAQPNPMVGAVIVHQGRIIGEGYHVCCGQGHAEVNAVKSLRRTALCELGASATEMQIQEWVYSHCREAEIYVSLEPCAHFGKTPPCADMLAMLQFKRCVIGCKDPFAKVSGRGIQKLKDAGIEVVVGVLEKECLELNHTFFTFHAKHRPYVFLKWAQSADGCMALKREKPEDAALQVSTPHTQMLIHKERSEYQAILVGKNTAYLDNPSLTVRAWVGNNPLKVVTETHKEIPHLLDELYQKGIQSLMVEGGRKLLDSFLESGLWDEIQVEIGTENAGENGIAAPQLPHDCVQEEFELFGHHFLRLFPKRI